jgi:hypothetical protein
MRPFVLALLSGVLLAAPAQKAPQPRPAAIDVLTASAHRDQNLLAIDAKLKNIGERTTGQLVVLVDVLDSDKRAVTTQKGESEPESIEAGQEGEFHAQMQLPPRAVYIRLNFEDSEGRDIKATNAGPFTIE